MRDSAALEQVPAGLVVDGLFFLVVQCHCNCSGRFQGGWTHGSKQANLPGYSRAFLSVVSFSGMAAAQAAPAGGTPPAARRVATATVTNSPTTRSNAGGFGPNDATIRVRPGPLRTTLIRPRTSFVPEMLKSVENL